jgi:transcriptional regulator with XRE-family HTH domain
MTSVILIEQKSTPGFRAKKLRISQHLTKRQLAKITGVSPEEVNLLEQNLPLRLESKLNIFRELWKRKAREQIYTVGQEAARKGDK